MTTHATVVLTHDDREPIVYPYLAHDEMLDLLACANLDHDRGLKVHTVFYGDFDGPDYVTCRQWEPGKGPCGAMVAVDPETLELPAVCPFGHPTPGSG